VYLGVCVRTVRYWDAGRCRVPWSAVRLLRLRRAGELGGLLDGWEGWTIWRDRLVSPDGRVFFERDMRHLWLTLTQAGLFREGYDRATLPSAAQPREGVERPSAFPRIEVSQVEKRTRETEQRVIRRQHPSPAEPVLDLLGDREATRCAPVSSFAARRAVGGIDTRLDPAAGGGGRDAIMTPLCSHEPADCGGNLGACNMQQTASVSHSSLPDDVCGKVPPANRGPTNLNGTHSDVTLASPCKGVA
jgi:hypothetical protein